MSPDGGSPSPAHRAMELAQVNLALGREPLDSLALRPFMLLLDEINAIADEAPGFLWRMQTEDGNATAVTGFPADGEPGRLVINMSVWTSFEALASYVYGGPHLEVMRRRREWFDRMPESYMAVWWVPAGHRPSVDDAEERVAVLRAEGVSPYAFSFREHFPAPVLGAERLDDERWGCPTS